MLYKLTSTYELLLDLGSTERPVRIEIFQSPDGKKFRARVWVQNTYNMYPTLMNVNEKGDDLHAMHSCDELNQEITFLILDDPDLIRGKEFESEKKLLQYLETRVNSFAESLRGNK
jgi:hypothetical protein